MAISVKMQARQSQKQGFTQSLAMTPQLAQSIKLLQMNAIDLARFVEEQVEKNPLLDLAGDINRPERGDTPVASDKTPDQAPEIGSELDTSQDSLESRLGTSLENEFDTDRTSGQSFDRTPVIGVSEGRDFSIGSPEIGNLEEYVEEKRSLGLHLREQLALTRATPEVLSVASEIIDQLDVDGFFRQKLHAVAMAKGVDGETAEAALALVQGFDPVGVAARDLGECLAIQLKEKNRFDPAMAHLVENLDLLAERKLDSLEDICGVTPDDLLDMLDEIRALEPRPARAFDTSPVATIVPDVFVHERPDGSFAVELNAETLPRVLINQTYKALVESRNNDREETTFFTDCLQNANWLVKSLEQRANTILKVTAEIVRQQDAFFAYGVSHMRPLSLRQVADAIGMHESTVSRVTGNKYVQTDRGTFELRYFFSASISSTGGGQAHSAEAVREKIRQMVDAEHADEVLSDDAIVRKLGNLNIDIARRTVAKYRESMGIASSIQRAREKKALNTRR